MYSYRGKKGVLGTLHQKEKAIAPPFYEELGLEIVKLDIDTDRLGTFTGEVERQGSALSCARQKCLNALHESGLSIAVSSEGSFFPHPYIPFVPCDQEILYFIDREIDLELYVSRMSMETNYLKETLSDKSELARFCDQVKFPSHAVILRPSRPSEQVIFKGIQSQEELEQAFLQSKRLASDGMCSIETDMRAHMNPTRMKLIGELAKSLAVRLRTFCPECAFPGFGEVDVARGLECKECGSETDLVKAKIMGCQRCSFQEFLPREDGLTMAEPSSCPFCNP